MRQSASCAATSAIWVAALLTAGCAGARTGGGALSASLSRSPPDPWFAALPNDVRIGEMAPGRFAMTYDYQGTVSCSMSWGSTSSRATVVLELAADGMATGCRGRNYFNVVGANDQYVRPPDSAPPRPPEETKRVEQQGMRGHWQRDGRAIVVDLQPAAGICAPHAAAAARAPEPWHLRCAFVEPAARESSVREPVLACAWRNDSEARPASLVTWDVPWTPAPSPIPFDDWAATAR
jgi:hypothetical protein